MVYVITDSSTERRTMLVRADDEDEVNARLKLTESQKIVGRFADTEIASINGDLFAIVSG